MAILREILAKFQVAVDDAALTKLDAGISNTIGSLKSFAGAIGGSLMLGSIFNFISGLTEEADALAKQADAMGLSLQEMQEWNYAAMMQGVNAEALNATLAKLGSGKFDKGLNELGIATTTTTGAMKSSTDLLEDVADALAKIDNPAERNRKAVAVLGKNYTKLLPLLKDGRKGISDLRKEFAAMGGGFSDEFAERADEFGDNVDRLKTMWKGFSIYIVGMALPHLVHLSQKIVSVAKPMMAWLKTTNALKAAAALLALKGVFVLSRQIGALGQALKALSTRALPLIALFLLVEDAMGFLEGKDSLIGRAIDGIFGPGTQDKVRDFLKSTKIEFSNFWDFVKLTGKIAWLELEAGFVHVAAIIADTFIDLWDEIVLAGKIAWTELEAGFVNLAAVIGDAFIKMWGIVMKGAGAVLKVLDKVVPGTSAGDKAIDEWVKENSGTADMSEMVNEERERKRAALVAQHDAIGSRLAATVSSVRDAERMKLAGDYDALVAKAKGGGGTPAAGTTNNTNNTNITVNVPPGRTDAQNIAKAVDDRMNAASRRAKPALVGGG